MILNVHDFSFTKSYEVDQCNKRIELSLELEEPIDNLLTRPYNFIYEYI